MKLYQIILLFFLVILSSSVLSNTALNKCVANPCKRNYFSHEPNAFIDPIEKYKLNINIKATYKNTNVYLNDEELKETDDKGFLKFTIPLRDKGKQCIKIDNQSFEFDLYKDMSLSCKGTKNFCCRTVYYN